MHRYHGRICAVISGLILLCGFGARVYAADPWLTEVLAEDTKLHVVFTSMMLDYQMQKGTGLAAIQKEDINDEGTALVRDIEITLPATKPDGNHKLTKPLEVRTQTGRRLRLLENTVFHYTLPETEAGYKVTLPKGTSLTKTQGAAGPEYVLARDITVKITPPEGFEITLTVDAQKVVERIPGTSGMGTTLTIKPMRAPVGEFITLTVAKDEFDFSKARFYVCLRKQGEDDTGTGREQKRAGQHNNPFIASRDVELKELQPGKARLQVRIPDINESGAHRAIPVDLLVVAREPDGELVEVLSKEFAVSSRGLAILCWVLAIAVPWVVAGIITACKQPKRSQPFNPIWYVSGKHGGASLSLAQILLWTMLVFSASFYVLVVSGKLLDLTNEVLMLLGIAGGSSVIAKITAAARGDKGVEIIAPQPKNPRWLDLFQTEGRPDLYKVQMALFTTLAAIFVTAKIYGNLAFPELPAGLLTLIGISNGVYLGAKATSKTVFEKLAETSSALLAAQEELITHTATADEANKRQQEAESDKARAITARDNTRDQLENEQDASKKVKLNELYEQQKTAAVEAEKRFVAADQTKKEADVARKAAAKRVKDLKDEFKKRKDEALSQS